LWKSRPASPMMSRLGSHLCLHYPNSPGQALDGPVDLTRSRSRGAGDADDILVRLLSTAWPSRNLRLSSRVAPCTVSSRPYQRPRAQPRGPRAADVAERSMSRREGVGAESARFSVDEHVERARATGGTPAGLRRTCWPWSRLKTPSRSRERATATPGRAARERPCRDDGVGRTVLVPEAEQLCPSAEPPTGFSSATKSTLCGAESRPPGAS